MKTLLFSLFFCGVFNLQSGFTQNLMSHFPFTNGSLIDIANGSGQLLTLGSLGTPVDSTDKDGMANNAYFFNGQSHFTSYDYPLNISPLEIDNNDFTITKLFKNNSLKMS